MAGPQKNPPAPKAAKKAAAKKQTYRDVPPVPTAKEIEQSISRGKSVSLEEFVKGVKL
jgi:hypothetical protein